MNQTPEEHLLFTYHSFMAEFSAVEDIFLSTLPEVSIRGGFGYSLKKLLCSIRGGDCLSCIVGLQCPYYFLFESPCPDIDAARQKFSYIPHPFIFRFSPDQPSRISKGENFCLEFSLVGKAIDYLPYIILGLESLGHEGIGPSRGKGTLESVVSLGSCSQRKIIYAKGPGMVKNHLPVTIRIPLSYSEKTRGEAKILQVDFITPIRIKQSGTYRHEMSFYTLVKGLVRRLSDLSSFYLCTEFPVESANELITSARHIKTSVKNLAWDEIQRYSTRQKSSMKIGGYIGTVSYEGDVDRFIPLLDFGVNWNIGKASSFGCGRIKYKIGETLC